MRTTQACVALVLVAAVVALPANFDDTALLDVDSEHVNLVADAAIKAYKGAKPAPAKPVDHVSHVAETTLKVHKDAAPKPKAPSPPVVPPPPPRDPKEVAAHAHRLITQATKQVWKDHDWIKEYTADIHNKHWHCRFCHEKCDRRSVQCHKWCHDKFCRADYDPNIYKGPGLIEKGKFSVGRIEPGSGKKRAPYLQSKSYLEAAKMRLDYALKRADKAAHYKTFRQAKRAIASYSNAVKRDLSHYKRQLNFRDGLNKQAFDSRRERAKNRKMRATLEKAHAKMVMKFARTDIKQTLKEKAKDTAYVQGAKAQEEVAAAMNDNSWDKALVKQADRYENVKATRASSEQMVSGTAMQAKLAKESVAASEMKEAANAKGTMIS